MNILQIWGLWTIWQNKECLDFLCQSFTIEKKGKGRRRAGGEKGTKRKRIIFHDRNERQIWYYTPLDYFVILGTY